MTKRAVAVWMLAIRVAVWDTNGGDEIVDCWYADLEARPHDMFVDGYYV